MPDAILLERIEAALDRIEAATTALRDTRDRAFARAELLDRAGAETIAALDRLIAAPADPA